MYRHFRPIVRLFHSPDSCGSEAWCRGTGFLIHYRECGRMIMRSEAGKPGVPTSEDRNFLSGMSNINQHEMRGQRTDLGVKGIMRHNSVSPSGSIILPLSLKLFPCLLAPLNQPSFSICFP